VKARRLRANQEIDDGRRGRGSVFGDFTSATELAFTALYAGRSAASFVDCLEQVER
jgi:hypothetical protein